MKDPIKELAMDLRSWRPIETLPMFMAKWIAWGALISAVSFVILPVRADFQEVITDFRYNLENVLWLLLASMSAAMLHLSSFPEKRSSKLKIPLLMVLIGLVALLGQHPGQMNQDHFHYEMQMWRGVCGLIILIMSLLHSVFLTLWTRRAAPRLPAMTGLWAALSAGSLGCLLMQAVCAHSSAAHLLVWHFVPLTFTSFLGSLAARQLLRW